MFMLFICFATLCLPLEKKKKEIKIFAMLLMPMSLYV